MDSYIRIQHSDDTTEDVPLGEALKQRGPKMREIALWLSSAKPGERGSITPDGTYTYVQY